MFDFLFKTHNVTIIIPKTVLIIILFKVKKLTEIINK